MTKSTKLGRAQLQPPAPGPGGEATPEPAQAMDALMAPAPPMPPPPAPIAPTPPPIVVPVAPVAPMPHRAPPDVADVIVSVDITPVCVPTKSGATPR